MHWLVKRQLCMKLNRMFVEETLVWARHPPFGEEKVNGMVGRRKLTHQKYDPRGRWSSAASTAAAIIHKRLSHWSAKQGKYTLFTFENDFFSWTQKYNNRQDEILSHERALCT